MRKRRKKKARPEIPQESRAAEALTVLWMLSALTTVVCEIGFLAAFWYVQGREEVQHVAALSFLLWLTAVVVGTLTLTLVPIVLKIRIEPPPLSVTIAAVIIGAAPWVMMLVS